MRQLHCCAVYLYLTLTCAPGRGPALQALLVIAGSTTPLPGGSGNYVLYQDDETLLISAGGHNESIDLPVEATVGHIAADC